MKILRKEKNQTEQRLKKERDDYQKMKRDKIKVEVIDLTKHIFFSYFLFCRSLIILSSFNLDVERK